MRNRRFCLKISLVIVTSLGLFLVRAEPETKKEPSRLFAESVIEKLTWRCIGPANMGGRIDDVAVAENNPYIIYIGTASGGLWKTSNNGVTWCPIFDDQVTSSIGDVALAPSNPEIVWVGTGEPNNRNSSSWGYGVYKSLDGGKSWDHMGLRDTQHIGGIAIHPDDPDIVYVAALGHLWGPNKERGLFKTTDGGKTWVNTKFVDENTGFVDVAMDPEDPETLYAAAYQRRRRGWGFNGGGPGSGLFKTTDGGKSWTHLTNGLPQGIVGRIGIDIHRKDSRIVYAIVEHKDGGVFRSEDKGSSWTKMSSINPRPMYYSKIRIDPIDNQRIWVLGGDIYVSHDGGKTFRTDHVKKIHGDFHAIWINPENSDHMIVGSDGGIHFSYDGGKTWDFINTLPLGQFYEIGYDMRQPYYIYGGMQDNGCWGGPSATLNSIGITNEDWFRILGGDGFYVRVDPSDPTTIYANSQRGNLFRYDAKTREAKSIRPEPDNKNEEYRFNWKSPIHISPFDSNTIYFGGNKLFISSDRGETWEATIDLTSQMDRSHIPIMGILPDDNTLSLNDGTTFYGDITTICESPLKKGLLYVGTDDGNLQISEDRGKSWKNIVGNVPEIPEHTYVSRIVASHFEEGRAYVTFDGHRNNDFKPYVFVSNDYGQSWKSIASNLPEGGTVNVIREHHKNPDLLFVGTERGAFISITGGGQWVRLKNNLPIVPVDDIAIHPRENDLIFATHGRSVWILDDITFLEQLNEDVLRLKYYLFDMRQSTIFKPFFHKGFLGHKIFVGPNPPFGSIISYYLREKSQEAVKIIIDDEEGKKIRELKGTGETGINRITWNLRYDPPPPTTGGEMGKNFRTRAPMVLPGEYKVTLNLAGHELSKKIRIEEDKRISVPFEDRKARHDALYALYKLYPAIYGAEKISADLSQQFAQAEEIIQTTPDVPQFLSQELMTLSKELREIRLELVGDAKQGWPGVSNSVRGRLVLTGRVIEGFSGAPSTKQLRQIQESSQELKTIVNRINRLIDLKIPRINEQMLQNNIKVTFSGEKIKTSQ